MNVHEVHVFLAHKIDKQKLKHTLFKNGGNENTIEL